MRVTANELLSHGLGRALDVKAPLLRGNASDQDQHHQDIA